MDSSVVHSKTANQSCTGVCDRYDSRSSCQMRDNKSYDISQLVDNHPTERYAKCMESTQSLKQEEAHPIEFTDSPSSQKSRSTSHCRTRKLYKDSPVPAKTVLLRWWLDTLGHSKPQITAWKGEEHYLHRLTQPHTKSQTFVGGPCLSYNYSPESGGAYHYIIKPGTRPQTSASCFSGHLNLLFKKTEAQKTNSQLSYAKSPPSDVSVNLHDYLLKRSANKARSPFHSTAKVGDFSCSTDKVGSSNHPSHKISDLKFPKDKFGSPNGSTNKLGNLKLFIDKVGSQNDSSDKLSDLKLSIDKISNHNGCANKTHDLKYPSTKAEALSRSNNKPDNVNPVTVGSLKKAAQSGMIEVFNSEHKSEVVCQQAFGLVIKHDNDENAPTSLFDRSTTDKSTLQDQTNAISIPEKEPGQIILDNMLTPSLNNVSIQGIRTLSSKQTEENSACCENENKNIETQLASSSQIHQCNIASDPSTIHLQVPTKPLIPLNNNPMPVLLLDNKEFMCSSSSSSSRDIDPDNNQCNGNNRYFCAEGAQIEENNLTLNKEVPNMDSYFNVVRAEQACANLRTSSVDKVNRSQNEWEVGTCSKHVEIPHRPHLKVRSPLSHKKDGDTLLNSGAIVHNYHTQVDSKASYFCRLAEKKFSGRRRMKDQQENKLQNCSRDLGAAKEKIFYVSSSSSPIRQPKMPVKTAISTSGSRSSIQSEDLILCKHGSSTVPAGIRNQPRSDRQSSSDHCSIQISRSLPLCLEFRTMLQHANIPKHIKPNAREEYYLKMNSLKENISSYFKQRESHFPSIITDDRDAVHVARSSTNESSFSKSDSSCESSYKFSAIRAHSNFSEKNLLLECVDGSLSSTSLPELAKNKLNRAQLNAIARKCTSLTNLQEEKHREIIVKARFLVLMLDELGLGDVAWSKALFSEESQHMLGEDLAHKSTLTHKERQGNIPKTTNTSNKMPSFLSRRVKPQSNIKSPTAVSTYALAQIKSQARGQHKNHKILSLVSQNGASSNKKQTNTLAHSTQSLKFHKPLHRKDDTTNDSTGSCTFRSSNLPTKIGNDVDLPQPIRISRTRNSDHQNQTKPHNNTATNIWPTYQQLRSHVINPKTLPAVLEMDTSSVSETRYISLINLHKTGAKSCTKTMNTLSRDHKAQQSQNLFMEKSLSKTKSVNSVAIFSPQNVTNLFLRSNKEPQIQQKELYQKSIMAKINLKRPERIKPQCLLRNWHKIHKRSATRNARSSSPNTVTLKTSLNKAASEKLVNRASTEKPLKTASLDKSQSEKTMNLVSTAAAGMDKEKKSLNYEITSVPLNEISPTCIPCESGAALEATFTASHGEGSITSSPGSEKISRKLPVYPRPIPNAVGGAPEGGMTGDESPETSLSSCSSRQLCLYGHSVMKNSSRKLSNRTEILTSNTCPALKSRRTRLMELLAAQKNSELNQSKTKILPPLCQTSMEKLTSEKNSQGLDSPNFNVLRSVESHDLHKSLEEQTQSSETKHSFRSGSRRNSLAKNSNRAPEKIRPMTRRMVLDSLEMGSLYFPLRRKTSRTKYKVSDVLIMPNSKYKLSQATQFSMIKSITPMTLDKANTKRNSEAVEVSLDQSDTCPLSLPHVDENGTHNSTGKPSGMQSHNPSCYSEQKTVLSNDAHVKRGNIGAQNESFHRTLKDQIATDDFLSSSKVNSTYFANSHIKHHVPVISNHDNKNHMNETHLDKPSVFLKHREDRPEIQKQENPSQAESHNRKPGISFSKKTTVKPEIFNVKPDSPDTKSFNFLMLLMSDEIGTENFVSEKTGTELEKRK